MTIQKVLWHFFFFLNINYKLFYVTFEILKIVIIVIYKLIHKELIEEILHKFTDV
jgi:hypothetical protein